MPDSITYSSPPARGSSGAKRPARQSLEGPTSSLKKSRRSSIPPPFPHDSQAKTVAPQSSILDLSSQRDISINQVDPESPLHEQPLTVEWERGLMEYRQKVSQPLEPPPDVQRIAALSKRYRIGGAYIHAFGIGHLSSVLQLGPDPNLRGNPRELNTSHIDNLFGVFSVPGSMRDHESPITIMLPRELVDTKLLGLMKNADPRDPAAEMPLLVLSHAHSHEVMLLEAQLLSHINDQRWMTEEELHAASQCLTSLRAQSPLATLLNGNHRIQALLRLGQSILDDHLQLLQQVRDQTIKPDEMRAEMADIQRRAKMTAYRVEVFDSAMPAELLNALVRNEDPRPQMGMGPGEKAWWTASRWDALMRIAQDEGYVTRAEQADQAFAIWSADVGGSSVAVSTVASQISSGSTGAGRVGPHRKGELAGGDRVSRLFTNPCTMEMVMDTRSAIPIYNTLLSSSISVAMVQSTGALLVARFWLACRTLLQIFNVAKGRGIEDAEQYIQSVPQLTVDGYPEAVEHWNNLHSHPQNTPQYISLYDSSLQAEFDVLYQSILADHQLTLDIDWDDDAVLQKVRHVFETLGSRLQNRGFEWSRRVGVAMRLHARLPVACEATAAHGPTFSGASALPAKRWIDRLVNERTRFALKQDGIVVLEFMIDRYLPIWTVGAQSVGTSVNINNWYGRSRGLHQILLSTTRAHTFGSMDVRLDQAVSFLNDPELRTALATVDEHLNDRFRSLMRQYCVLRSHGVEYPFLAKTPASFLEQHGGLDNLRSQIALARSALKSIIFAPERPLLSQYEEFLRIHPAFAQLIPHDFFQDFDPVSWVEGWNSSSEKRYRDVNSLAGWAFMSVEVDSLIEQLMIAENARPLIQVCYFLAELSSRKPWWYGLRIATSRGSAASCDPEVLQHNTAKSNLPGHGKPHPLQAISGENGVPTELDKTKDVCIIEPSGTTEHRSPHTYPTTDDQSMAPEYECAKLNRTVEGEHEHLSNPEALQNDAHHQEPHRDHLSPDARIDASTDRAREDIGQAAHAHQPVPQDSPSPTEQAEPEHQEEQEAHEEDEQEEPEQEEQEQEEPEPEEPEQEEPEQEEPEQEEPDESDESDEQQESQVSDESDEQQESDAPDEPDEPEGLQEPDQPEEYQEQEYEEQENARQPADRPPMGESNHQELSKASSTNPSHDASANSETPGVLSSHAALESSAASEQAQSAPSFQPNVTPSVPRIFSNIAPLVINAPQDSVGITHPSVGCLDSWRYIEDCKPHYIMTPPCAPTRTLDFVLGCAVYNDHADVNEARLIIEQNAQQYKELTIRIVSERQKLRQSLTVAAHHCIEAEYGGFYAATGLASMISSYKDIFVARVAQILESHLGLNRVEAINEAVSMASTDDLFSADIAHFDLRQGGLSLDLSKTFARTIQEQLHGEQIVRVGTVLGTEEDRNELNCTLLWFHPVRGVGQSRLQSTIRGREAAVMQDVKQTRLRWIDTELMATIPKDAPPPPRGPDYFDRTPDIRTVHTQWGFRRWRPPSLNSQLSLQPWKSPLSTGIFLEQRSICKNVRLRPDMAELAGRALLVATQAQADWISAQEQDQVAYEQWCRAIPQPRLFGVSHNISTSASASTTALDPPPALPETPGAELGSA